MSNLSLMWPANPKELPTHDEQYLETTGEGLIFEVKYISRF